MLNPGTSLAHYEILEPIGKGGMGEVYRARDTKLKRDVAIKVLPEAFASDEQRMKGFAREAELLASLNHPNIASIYGLEHSDGTNALVLELVEGPTLADRIAQGPIPVDEARAIARQIAEALEAAHERGIIHRDLKPANVKVRDDGTVKILDFGLAKALDKEEEGNPSESPTLSAAATRAGVIMGTAAYMSPEQARGKRVDKRSDIWAFGVVLYEMLTGRRAFEAVDVSFTLAEVMKSEPDWDALPPDVSPGLRTFLIRCLAKDPKKRVRDIGDVRLALDGAFDVATLEGVAVATEPRASRWIAAVVLTALVAGLAVWRLTRPDAPHVMRLTLSTPVSTPTAAPLHQDLAISPDGTWVVYTVDHALYLRRLDRFESTLLVEHGHNPFVSPDGAWVGFSEGTVGLQKIPVGGGPATTICSVGGEFRGGSWGEDDVIIFASEPQGLFKVPAGGGEPQQLTKPDGEVHLWPAMLPGSEAVLFAIGRQEGGEFDVAALSFESGERRLLIRGGTSPRYLPTGHLLYCSPDALMAVPFDAERLETKGDAVPAVSGVFPKFTGAVNYDVSNDGVLLYLPGKPEGGNRSLVWVDRQGGEEPIPVEPRPYLSIALSPEGDRVVSFVVSEGSAAEDIWIQTLARGTQTRLTFDPAPDAFPVWTSDGEGVVFRSERDGVGLYRKAANGTGSAEQVVEGAFFPFSVSPGGTRIVGTMRQGETTWDIAEVFLEEEARLRFLVTDPDNQWHPQISPSGNWMAYQSRESGRREIYVRPYPDVDEGRWQVSTDGGAYPMWSPNEDELFYRLGEQVVVVPVVVTRDSFEHGKPSVLFEGDYWTGTPRNYDVAPDGQRFLMMKDEASGETSQRQEMHVILNWHEELRAISDRK